MRSYLQLLHRLYKLKPIILTGEIMWHLECGRDFEVNRNCKKTTLFFGKRTTKNTEERHRGTPDVAMLRLHISCTVRTNGSFAIRRNAEFFSCGMRKSDRGNLRNVPHLIFRKLPLDNFPHSAKYPRPDRYALSAHHWSASWHDMKLGLSIFWFPYLDCQSKPTTNLLTNMLIVSVKYT